MSSPSSDARDAGRDDELLAVARELHRYLGLLDRCGLAWMAPGAVDDAGATAWSGAAASGASERADARDAGDAEVLEGAVGTLGEGAPGKEASANEAADDIARVEPTSEKDAPDENAADEDASEEEGADEAGTMDEGDEAPGAAPLLTVGVGNDLAEQVPPPPVEAPTSEGVAGGAIVGTAAADGSGAREAEGAFAPATATGDEDDDAGDPWQLDLFGGRGEVAPPPSPPSLPPPSSSHPADPASAAMSAAPSAAGASTQPRPASASSTTPSAPGAPPIELPPSAFTAFGAEPPSSSPAPTLEPPPTSLPPTDRDAADITMTPRRATASAPSSRPPSATAPEPALALDDRRAALASLAAEIAACTACELCARRTHTVPGEGHPAARLMFIGEGPGENEDLQGRPFVGRAGQLLDRMIAAMGLAREEVFIANAVKCRPPGNRNPTAAECAACEPFLQRQIAVVRPEVIVLLGRVATQLLLRTDQSMKALRGAWYEFEGIPVAVTYHPAYLLRSPGEKGKAWEDLQRVMERLGLEPPAKGA